MSRFYPITLSVEDCETSQDALVQWINGSGDAPPHLLERTSLETLKGAADGFMEGAADEEDPAVRMRGMYVLSLYRDALYAHATRGQLLGAGARSKFVDLYEGALIAATYPAE